MLFLQPRSLQELRGGETASPGMRRHANECRTSARTSARRLLDVPPERGGAGQAPQGRGSARARGGGALGRVGALRSLHERREAVRRDTVAQATNGELDHARSTEL